jgi:hypothetical protein
MHQSTTIRRETIKFRVTAAELSRLDGEAQEEGLTRSKYLRQRLLGKQSEAPGPLAIQMARFQEIILRLTEAGEGERDGGFARSVAAAVGKMPDKVFAARLENRPTPDGKGDA